MLIAVVIIPIFDGLFNFLFLAIPGIIFFLPGIVLTMLAARTGPKGLLKKFLLLTGAAPIGTLASVILHNVFYGVFIHFFGADFWDRIGAGDEPVFFILAIIVCPSVFLAGVIGSIIMFRKEKRIT